MSRWGLFPTIISKWVPLFVCYIQPKRKAWEGAAIASKKAKAGTNRPTPGETQPDEQPVSDAVHALVSK